MWNIYIYIYITVHLRVDSTVSHIPCEQNDMLSVRTAVFLNLSKMGWHNNIMLLWTIWLPKKIGVKAAYIKEYETLVKHLSEFL